MGQVLTKETNYVGSLHKCSDNVPEASAFQIQTFPWLAVDVVFLDLVEHQFCHLTPWPPGHPFLQPCLL